MSSLVALYIDSSHAKLFKFNAGKLELVHIKPHGPIHHAEALGRNHTKAEGDAEKFYHQVAAYLQKDPDSKWLVLGSGLGHTHFVHHIQTHHPRFAKNIVGNRTVAHQTDNQLTAEAKNFFVEMGLLEEDRLAPKTNRAVD